MKQLINLIILISISSYGSNKVNNDQKIKEYNIYSIVSENKIDAKIITWQEIKNHYLIGGRYLDGIRVYILEYIDTEGNIFKGEGVDWAKSFISLCDNAEKINVNMLIKGRKINVYHRPYKDTLKGVELFMGEKLKYNSPTINILDSEEDINSLGTLKEQEEFFVKWLHSLERPK